MEYVTEILNSFFGFLKYLGVNWWQFLIFFMILFFGFIFYKSKSSFVDLLKVLKKDKNKISCIDCFKILEGKRFELKTKVDKVENSVLKSQMSFCEQKLVEILFVFIDNFSKVFKGKMDTDDVYTFLVFLKEKFKDDHELYYKIVDAIEKLEINKEIIQTKLYWSIIYESLEKSVKDELRRSFKENGFDKLDDASLKIYLQNRHKVIFSIIVQQIINLYPKSAGMLLPQEEIIEMSKELIPSINSVIDEIYIEGIKIKLNSESEIKQIEDKIYKEIDEFINGIK